MIDSQSKTENGTVRTYAIRRLNPFRGVMQVIEAEQGRALSCNGIVWEILVRAGQSPVQDCSDQGNQRKIYYRFGMWSMSDGLLQRSNSPAEDQDYFDLAKKCEALAAHARANQQRLPFKLEDNRELWLFDGDSQKPLALLASSRPTAIVSTSEPDDWSCCIGTNGSPSQRRFPQSQKLAMQVRQRAGLNINKRWIRRMGGGDGVVEIKGEVIAGNQFPTLLLEEGWANDEEQQRACDYIKWISPSLLTLQHLDKRTRLRVENYLHVQAISIEHHWHLYPEIINDKLVKAARVQSRIERCG